MEKLAEYLKSERVERGLTLRAVSESARVSVDMLRALEEGHFDQIGTALLIRSFVKAYCEALGIDPAPLLEQHEAEIRACDTQDESIRRYGLWSRSHPVARRMGFWGLLILVVLLIGLLCAGVWVYKTKVRLAETDMTTLPYPQQEYPSDLSAGPAAGDKTAKAGSSEVPVPPEKTVAATESSPGETRVPEAPEPVGNRQKPPAEKPLQENNNSSLVLAEDIPAESAHQHAQAIPVHRFQVEADQKTWLQVKIDDDSTHSVLLQPGDKREWETKKGMSVVVGNAGGVRMIWDDKPLDFNGKPGQVLRFRLPDSTLVEPSKPVQQPQ